MGGKAVDLDCAMLAELQLRIGDGKQVDGLQRMARKASVTRLCRMSQGSAAGSGTFLPFSRCSRFVRYWR